MSEPDPPPAPDRLVALLAEPNHEEAAACLDRLDAADAETRKRALRAVRNDVEDSPTALEAMATPLAAFLTDDDRAVRLTTAKLFVALAQSEPATVLPVVDALADRLADDDEFYYVRARCAEALGYVAVDSPGEVTDPETLADLRIGLSFDEPEVKEKLAKALSYVALGDPDRLGHRADSLAEHLDDDDELVRYHLCTTLVVIGCAHPRKLDDATAALRERLDDENPYVRGRAAEALGLVAGADVATEWSPEVVASGVADDDAPSFLTDRTRFCRRQVSATQSGQAVDGVGTVESVRAGTDEVVAEMTAPDGGECPQCGLALAGSGPPTCPRCGAPR